MNKKEKTKQAFRLVEAWMCGYSSRKIQPKGLSMDTWTELFENCYKGVKEMLKKADEIDPQKPKMTTL